jgi:hypothetical protein
MSEDNGLGSSMALMLPSCGMCGLCFEPFQLRGVQSSPRQSESNLKLWTRERVDAVIYANFMEERTY